MVVVVEARVDQAARVQQPLVMRAEPQVIQKRNWILTHMEHLMEVKQLDCP